MYKLERWQCVDQVQDHVVNGVEHYANSISPWWCRRSRLVYRSSVATRLLRNDLSVLCNIINIIDLLQLRLHSWSSLQTLNSLSCYGYIRKFHFSVCGRLRRSRPSSFHVQVTSQRQFTYNAIAIAERDIKWCFQLCFWFLCNNTTIQETSSW